MADVPFMDEERGAEEARQRALWAARGLPLKPIQDEEVTPEQLTREKFDKSPFGWVDRKLKSGTDWVRERMKKRQAPFAELAAKGEGSWHTSLPDPVELVATMGLEGGRTANRWLAAAGGHGPMLREEDLLGPLGAGGMTAPFAAAKHGISLGSAGGKLASQAALPFEAARAARELDMSREARMERARQMGFDTENPRYVSALQPIDEFEKHGKFMGHQGVSGISVSDKPELASRYLDRYGETDYQGKPFNKNMMQVYIRPGESAEFDAPLRSSVPMGHPLPEGYEWPKSLDGLDSVTFPDRITKRGHVAHLPADTTRPFIEGRETILRDPSQIRSVNAAFDPEQAHSANLLAANPGTEQILELMRAQQQLQSPFTQDE